MEKAAATSKTRGLSGPPRRGRRRRPLPGRAGAVGAPEGRAAPGREGALSPRGRRRGRARAAGEKRGQRRCGEGFIGESFCLPRQRFAGSKMVRLLPAVSSPKARYLPSSKTHHGIFQAAPTPALPPLLSATPLTTTSSRHGITLPGQLSAHTLPFFHPYFLGPPEEPPFHSPKKKLLSLSVSGAIDRAKGERRRALLPGDVTGHQT